MYPLASLLALATVVSAQVKGFNYGSTFTDGSAKQQSDFESEFTTAQGLVGAPGFTSARLYTMVQAGSANNPIAAIPAAISTKTSLLLGLWASGGDTAFDNEVTALSNAITQYGDAFTSIVVGISVGSEDLYRNSPQGIASNSDVGAEPTTIVNYINQVRNAIQGTSLSGAQVGHVDTWTAWVNGSNDAVSSACDFIGVDAYPYFQNTMVNDIGVGASLFASALSQTQDAVGGKPVWVTETGWPVSGSLSGNAQPSTENAQTYWDQVGCDTLFGKINTWWYTLQDAAPTTPNPSFGVVGSDLSTTPLYDLSCSNVTSSSSSSAVSSATSAASSVSSEVSSSAGSQSTASAGGDTEGSPGAGGIESSQISLEASATGSTSLAGPSAAATATASATASSGSSGSGSGSGAGVGSGSSGSSAAASSAAASSGSASSGSGSSGTGSGSGAGSTSGTGSGAGIGSGSNSTAVGSSPGSTGTPVQASATGLQSTGAALLAILVAIMAF